MATLLPDTALAVGILTAVTAGLIHKILKIGRRENLLPPGPPTIPLLGNIHLLPKEDMHLAFNEWAKQYGEIFSLKVSFNTIIVLSSPDAVMRIMEKNGSITAGRPVFPHMIAMFGQDGALSIVQYGPLYRTWRRAANEMMRLSACERHLPIQLGEASQLMVDIIDRPEDFFEEVKRTVFSVSFSVFFGVRTPSMSSPQLQKFMRTLDDGFRLSAPGDHPPVDMLPILNYIPDRFANNWRARSEEVRKDYESICDGLLMELEKKLEAGISTGCFMETLMSRASEWNLDRTTIKNMAGNYMVSAAHTTIATIQWFMKLATVHQDIQAKLGEEMDRVVGLDRPPNPDDMPNLPYLRAFLRELFRFRTIVPLGLPHVATEDQMYNDYLIPKGTILFANIWGIFHDPKVFERPDEFNPDRWLNPTAEQAQAWKNIETLQFGVGRRICPGMHLANTTVELTAALLIWGFELGVPAEGVPDVNDYHIFVTCDPSPFKCDIKPRSLAKANMMRHTLASCQPTLVIFEKSV